MSLRFLFFENSNKLKKKIGIYIFVISLELDLVNKKSGGGVYAGVD